MKYEERVEIGERWSKPHVSTTSLRGIHMFRDALLSKQCSVALDRSLPVGDFQIAGLPAALLFSVVCSFRNKSAHFKGIF